MRRTAAIAGCLAWILCGSVVTAQAPKVPPEQIDGYRRVQGDRVTFCVFSDSPTADFDRAVAQELAGVLLLTPAIYEVKRDIRTPLTDQELFILLTDHCDGFLGFTLYPEGYPGWLSFSRAYYRTPYVLAVKETRFRRLSDIPKGQPIGTHLSSLADIQLILHQRSRSQRDQWKRFPYPTDELLVQRLLDGTISGALIWGPELYRLTGGDPGAKGIRVIDASPLRNLEWGIGVALRSRDTFVRTTIDKAIVALIEDGVIKDLLAKNRVLGRPGPVG